ncbi:MAG: MBL fold metallo-hydrolase [FCB group bacterium]|jgi:glyoxylase-like metal-dependent hydrolase (beta-lactamase superfamily II)
MRISILKKNPMIYSCNVYLIRGDWNKIDDINTLIDVGIDGFIIDELNGFSTGVGKKRVEQVILTHEHFDHAGGLKKIYHEYKPIVYAYSKFDFVSTVMKDGMYIKTGDKYSMIIHTPGHSNDSVCIYNEEEQILFSGDIAININTVDNSYTNNYVIALERLTKLKIKTIFPGHEAPITKNAEEILKNSFNNVIKSKILD